ncbi:MAG TPA: rhomboid family intramembrane serine protease [Acidimicrobiia bacterium]|nr:rhomboid family intramembrane serine protease [Acidimicrobiia bacterium]
MTTPPENQNVPTAQSVCYRHSDRPTFLSCAQCGNPICPECAVQGTVGQFCPDCARLRGQQKMVKPRAARGSMARTAPATFAFMAIAIGIFVVTRGSDSLEDQMLLLFAQINDLVARGDWYRIFTPVLVHANLTHILFNMYALYQLGPAIEARVGIPSYLGLLLAAAGWGGAFAYHLGGPGDALVGASGAIFGLFGLWLHSAFRLRDTAFGRNLLSSLGLTLALNLALPFLIPGISWQGHLGGLIAGVLIGELWSRVKRPQRPVAALAMAVVAVLAVLV